MAVDRFHRQKSRRGLAALGRLGPFKLGRTVGRLGIRGTANGGLVLGSSCTHLAFEGFWGGVPRTVRAIYQWGVNGAVCAL